MKLNEIKRMQQLAGILKELDENTSRKIIADDIQVGAMFEEYSTVYEKRIKIEISRIESNYDGDSVYFKYIGMSNQGDYLLAGSREEAADILNKNQGELIQAAPRVKKN